MANKRIPPQADLRQLDGTESSMSPEKSSAKCIFVARQLCANRYAINKTAFDKRNNGGLL